MHLHWLKVLERSCVCFSKVSPSATMSLLGVPEFPPFPPIFSSPTTTPTPLNEIRLNPCATPLWGGPSGHLADPTPNTGYEPKFCMDVSCEHTPVNLPDSNRNFPHHYDATTAASEDLTLPQHSGASSRSQHTAASTVPTLLKPGSVGTGSRKLVADYESVASQSGSKKTGCGRGSRNNCSKCFRISV